MQCNLVVGGEACSCTAPFSWLIRLSCHSLWEESQFVQGEKTKRVSAMYKHCTGVFF